MQPSLLGLVLAIGLSLPAQDGKAPPAEGELPQLRAAFAALPADGPKVAIACVRGGEPVILTAGVDADGREISRQTLLPLFAMAKVLAADAIVAQDKARLDQKCGVKLGGTEPTLREMLAGTALLPDYFVFDGSKEVADAATLLACGGLAVGGKVTFRATTLGAAEFVLLEPLAFAGRHKDWPGMLRSALAAQVPGLNPVDAASKDATGSMVLQHEDFAKLAAAKPALLRTMLSVKDLASWWQSRQDVQPWNSERMGSTSRSLTRATPQMWRHAAHALGFAMQCCHYPAQQARLLSFSPVSRSQLQARLQWAFEADLFAGMPADDGKAEPVLAAAGGGGPVAPGVVPATRAMLVGSRWHTPAQDGAASCQLAFGAKAPLVMTLGTSSVSMTSSGPGVEWWTAWRGDGIVHAAWLWPHLDGDRPVKLGAVIVAMNVSGMDTAVTACTGSSVPQYVELVPDVK